MPELQHFRLPDVGEGLTEADIVAWKVKPGDVVAINDPLVEIETAKSLVELPSPYAGVVADLLVTEGQTVDVGTPIIAIDADPSGDSGGGADAGTGAAAQVDVPSPPAEGAVEPGLIGGPAPGGRTSVLVGYGPRTTEAKRRPRKGTVVPDSPAAATAHEALQAVVAPVAANMVELAAEHAPSALPGAPDAPAGANELPSTSGGRVSVLAKPPVRKLAKSLGVDLASVAPSTPGGVIGRAEVEAAAAGLRQPTPEVADGERETRVPIRGVRKLIAQAMVASAFTAPHVTEWVDVDMTRTLRLLARVGSHRDFEGMRLSPLVVVAKALLLAVRRHPAVNACWDEPAQEIVLKHYVNLGIAAATPRGLVVPNIKEAQAKSLPELAEALTSLITTAREGKTSPQEMQGGTITITNVGVFGVDAGTPILNPGEAAILAFGAVRDRPWVVKGKIKPRKVTTLALSFDHRLIDGELGSRFLADLAALLENPDLALLW